MKFPNRVYHVYQYSNVLNEVFYNTQRANTCLGSEKVSVWFVRLYEKVIICTLHINMRNIQFL